MNRQIKAERAFIIPYELSKKLGDFTMPTLLRLKETDVRGLMKNPKPLHRHFEKMAGVLFKAIQFIGQRYNSDVSQIWRNKPSSATVVYRFLEFDGVGPILFGTQIAAGGFYRGFT
jgi:hypothetical protein